jgi:hypothetical protein
MIDNMIIIKTDVEIEHPGCKDDGKKVQVENKQIGEDKSSR